MTEEYEDDEIVKKIALITRRAPHGSIYAYEGLETVLIMAAYDQDISMIFIDDGVYALKSDQDTEAIGIKGFVKTLTFWKIMMLKNCTLIKPLWKKEA